MKLNEIDSHILNSKTNSYEIQNNIFTKQVITLLEEKDICFKKVLKSDNTHTLIVCIKTNRSNDNWIYFAPTESQVNILSKFILGSYLNIDMENKSYKNKELSLWL